MPIRNYLTRGVGTLINHAEYDIKIPDYVEGTPHLFSSLTISKFLFTPYL